MQKRFHLPRNSAAASAMGRRVAAFALVCAALTASGIHSIERPVFAAPAMSAASAAATAMLPAAGAQQVPADMQLHISFSAPPALGKGNIQIFDASNDTLVESIDVAPVPPPARGGGGFGRGGGRGRGATAPATGAASQAAAPPPPPARAPAPPGPVVLVPPSKMGNFGGGNFRYYPVIISGNDVTITPAQPFAMNKSYYVTVDAVAFKFGDGNTPSSAITGSNAWRFSTRSAAPASGNTRITVAADGTGDFATVQGAINYVPAGNTTPATIFIKKGMYNEIISFTGKNALTFLGEDRKKTILVYANNANFNGQRGTFMTRNVSDLVIANLTLHNTTPQGGSQAETIILSGTPEAHAIVTNVDMLSLQDTIQINGQAYVSDCYIEGNVDFMWGTGPCYFENCLCTTTRDKGYYTQIRNRDGHGYVYDHCTFDGKEGITGNFLGRIDPSGYPKSQVVLLDCLLGPSVAPVGWLLNGQTQEAPQLQYWEFNSRDLKGNPVDTSQRLAASKQLTLPADAETINNYRDPKWALGGNWTPTLAPVIAAAPVAAPADGKTSLTVQASGIPEPTYQWQKNGVDVSGATKASLSIDGSSAADVGSYTVVVTNSAGKATSPPAMLH